MRMSANTAMKTRQDSRKVQGFGKRWKSGETHLVAYPIFFDENGEPQLLVGAGWGHPIDPKAISVKAIFWPSHSEIVDGVPKVADLAYQASRIMPLVLKGSYAAEVKKVEESDLSNSQKKQSLKEIDKKYEVDDDGKITKQPAISRLKFIVTTEIFDVPLVADTMAPNIKEARVVSQDLSDEKIRAIRNLMLNPNHAPKSGDRYFWVQYAFGTQGDRKIDGRVAPTGIMPEYRIEVRYPEEFAKIKSELESLPVESESVMKRNSVFTKGDDRDLMSALQTYWILNEDKLNDLSEDTDIDRLKKVAKVVRDLKVPVHNVILLQEIEKLEKEEKELKISENALVNEEKDAAPNMANLIDKEDIDAAIAESGTDENFSSEITEAAGSGNFAAMAEDK